MSAIIAKSLKGLYPNVEVISGPVGDWINRDLTSFDIVISISKLDIEASNVLIVKPLEAIDKNHRIKGKINKKLYNNLIIKKNKK